MKWIKIAITVVIMLVSVGIIATSVYGMTQETVKEEVVTFEVLTENTVTSGTFDLIDKYTIFGLDMYSTNLKLVKVNNTLLSMGNIYKDNDIFSIAGDMSGDYDFVLVSDDTITTEGYNIVISDVWEITFEIPQPPQLTGSIAALLLLTPLIFASGVLYFMLRKNDIGG